MPENGERGYIGLCSTCNNGPTCQYRLKRGVDAIFCEMFDDYSDPSAEETNKDKGDSAPEQSDSANYKGLCINCANRKTCKLIKPDEGVWHCEEYC